MKKLQHDYEIERYLFSMPNYDWEIVFGKWDSFPLSHVVKVDRRYLEWMTTVNFPERVLLIVRNYLDP